MANEILTDFSKEFEENHIKRIKWTIYLILQEFTQLFGKEQEENFANNI